MRRQGEGDRRVLPAIVTAAFERQANRVGMWHITLKRLADGRIELARAVTIQQPEQGGGDAAEVIAALSGAEEQDLAGRRGLCQAIGRSVAAGLTFRAGCPDLITPGFRSSTPRAFGFLLPSRPRYSASVSGRTLSLLVVVGTSRR